MDTIQFIVEHGFYLAGLFFIIYELGILHYLLTHPSYQDGESISYKNKKVVFVGYFLWIAGGIYSSQWLLFVLLFGLSFLDTKKRKTWWIIDSIVSVSIIILIIFNKYYYHYDLESYKRLFKIININL